MTPLSPELLESVAAAAVREGLADALFTRVSTPIGRLLVVQGPHGVVRVGFEEEPEDRVLAEVAARLGPRIVASDRELALTRDTLDAYFAGEGDPHDAGRPLDHQQTADRGAQAGEDGVGEAHAHGGGGDGLEQGVGERGHAAALSRRVRTAVDTRWRAATVEMPSRSPMPS